jgi:hypothetical protein
MMMYGRKKEKNIRADINNNKLHFNMSGIYRFLKEAFLTNRLDIAALGLS